MQHGRPSLTARRVAMRRAAHQVLERPPVFEDPVAVRMAESAGIDVGRELQSTEATPVAPYLRAFIAVRSRCAEDELARAIERGVSQYVILGAGLDTFAYRNPFPSTRLRVFEVDHPDTQAWKRECVANAGLKPTGDLTFAPIDFETQSLPQALQAAGCSRDAPAFFSWLGVTPYLAAGTVLSTLQFIGSGAAGSGVVFDYAIAPALLDAFQLKIFQMMTAKVAAAGEPFQSAFDPVELAGDLHSAGFDQVEDLSPDVINARYFADRADGLKVGSLGRLVIACRETSKEAL
jgi:methyltransferase (TIGR00027 family)